MNSPTVIDFVKATPEQQEEMIQQARDHIELTKDEYKEFLDSNDVDKIVVRLKEALNTPRKVFAKFSCSICDGNVDIFEWDLDDDETKHVKMEISRDVLSVKLDFFALTVREGVQDMQEQMWKNICEHL